MNKTYMFDILTRIQYCSFSPKLKVEKIEKTVVNIDKKSIKTHKIGSNINIYI